jgi:hypothetical protein
VTRYVRRSADPVEAYKAVREHELMLNEATSRFEHAMLAPLAILNGGAAVAFLTLMGAMLGKESGRKPDLNWALGAAAAWVAGLLAAAVAVRCGAGRQRAVSIEYRAGRQDVEAELFPGVAHMIAADVPEPPLGARTWGDHANRLRKGLNWLWLVSLLLFVAGGLLAGLSVRKGHDRKPAGRGASVVHRPRPVRAAAELLAAVPEPVVERARRDADARRDPLAGVHGAGADLALHRLAGRELEAPVDALRELGRVVQDALGAQHVRQQVVGEDGQPVDVREVRDAGEHEVVGRDLGALVEAAVGEEGHALGEQRG